MVLDRILSHAMWGTYLEASSRINFAEFAEMADLLIADDGGPLALLEDGSRELNDFEEWQDLAGQQFRTSWIDRFQFLQPPFDCTAYDIH